MSGTDVSEKIVLATRNPAKVALYAQAFKCYGWDAIGLDQFASVQPAEETGETTEANALLKARAAWTRGRTVFATDVGLEIDALSGEPGVQTRRWNGKFSDDISDAEWLEYLLYRMNGVPLPQRTAKSVTGWALIRADGQSAVKRIVTPFLVAERSLFPLVKGWPMSAVVIRLSGTEPDEGQAVRRELGNWYFFRNSLLGRTRMQEIGV